MTKKTKRKNKSTKKKKNIHPKSIRLWHITHKYKISACKILFSFFFFFTLCRLPKWFPSICGFAVEEIYFFVFCIQWVYLKYRLNDPRNFVYRRKHQLHFFSLFVSFHSEWRKKKSKYLCVHYNSCHLYSIDHQRSAKTGSLFFLFGRNKLC